MPFATAEDAVETFAASIRRAIQCIGEPHVQIRTWGLTAGTMLPFAVHQGDPFRLHGSDNLFLTIEMPFLLEHVDTSWRVRVAKYFFTFEEKIRDDFVEVLTYHWDPDNAKVPFPHLHIKTKSQVESPALISMHLPTGRVLVEDIVWLAIHEFGERYGVQARFPLDEWQSILRDTRRLFDDDHSWGGSPS